MKKLTAIILALILALGCTALAEEEAIPAEASTFATIGEAMESEGYTGIASGDDQHFVVVVKSGDSYFRLVANIDEKAKELGNATLEYTDADALAAAFDAYNEYIKTLPIAYEEEITASPQAQEDLDGLAGMTLLEVEEKGYEFSSSEMGENDTAIYTVKFGLYDYNLILNETYTEYMEHEENGYTGDLTVKSASFAGLSRNAAELRYHADGTYDEENDPWAEYNALMEMISNALSSGNPEEAIQALTEAMPEQADEIRMFADVFASMTEQSEESEGDSETDADEDEADFYTNECPDAAAYYSTWVAEDGDWRIEVYDEAGGLKLMIVHKLGDNKEDIWEYAAALSPEKDALTAVPLGLHYRQDTVTGDWDETYYEDGDATFTINEAGMLLWNDLKEDAGKDLQFLKIGNFFGGRWMKDDIEVIFYEWYDGQYDIRLYQRSENGEILNDTILKGDYDPDTDTLVAEGFFDPDAPFIVTFSYDENRNILWTENGESTVMEYSYLTD